MTAPNPLDVCQTNREHDFVGDGNPEHGEVCTICGTRRWTLRDAKGRDVRRHYKYPPTPIPGWDALT